MHSAETDEILQQLERLNLKGQSIEIYHYYVPLGQCDSCTAAYAQCVLPFLLLVPFSASRALSTRTGRRPGPVLVVEEIEFLDSWILYKWFSNPEVQSSMRDDRYVQIPLFSVNPHVRIVPVFVLELAKISPLSFENGAQSIGFSNLVLGVRTHGGTYLSEMSCGGQIITISATNITRPLMASLLQTGLPKNSRSAACLSPVQCGLWQRRRNSGHRHRDVCMTIDGMLDRRLLERCRRCRFCPILCSAQQNAT